MKILNKFILSVCIFGLPLKAFATNLPPFSNEEVQSYADMLIKKDLHNLAKQYYLELARRGDKIDSTWGLALVNLREGDNFQALKKVNFLLQQENTDKSKLEALKGELLINLAESAYYNQQPTQAEAYLNEYYQNFKNIARNVRQRADVIQSKLSFTHQNQALKVGVILPLSGKLEKVGEKIQNALLLAMYEKNMANISLYIEDNKSTQEGSIQAATNLLKYNPDVYIGPILRDNVLAANTVISSTQAPIFTFSNDATIANRNIFLNNVNLIQEAKEITRFAYDNGNYKLACIYPDNTSGQIQEASFERSGQLYEAGLTKCSSYNPANVDITPTLKDLLDINKNNQIRKAKLRALEKEFDRLGNAMSDEKLKEMQELKEDKDVYDVDFSAIFIPDAARKIPAIAPQLAYYDIDFSNGVMFLGNSAWDNDNILESKGEHLHFSRFLSLRTKEYNKFEQRYKTTFKQSPNLLAGFAYDVLNIIQDINFSNNFYSQIYRPYGFNVLTGNVRFTSNNTPERVYGVNKIARRAIKPVQPVFHQRPIDLPNDLSIEKAKGLGGWFGF